MDCDFRRHQQPVGSRGGAGGERKEEGAGSRALSWLPPALCITAIVLAFVMVSAVPVVTGGSSVAGGSTARSAGEASISQEAEVERSGASNPGRQPDSPAEEGDVPACSPGLDGAGAEDEQTQGGRATSATFMGELAELAEATEEAEVSMSWEERRDLVDVAGDVLRAYEEAGTARLATSGFVDLKGNIWGAVIEDERGWVDVVTVMEGAGSASSHVRIIRMLPRGWEGS